MSLKETKATKAKMQVLTRSLRTAALSARGARQMGSGAHKAHVHMPETAMLTNNVRPAPLLLGSSWGRSLN